MWVTCACPLIHVFDALLPFLLRFSLISLQERSRFLRGYRYGGFQRHQSKIYFLGKRISIISLHSQNVTILTLLWTRERKQLFESVAVYTFSYICVFGLSQARAHVIRFIVNLFFIVSNIKNYSEERILHCKRHKK